MIHRSAIVGSLCGAVLLLLSPAARAAQPCTENCARVVVGGADMVTRGSTVPIPLSFFQGPDDGQPNQGNDQVAAIALTLGIPGTGTTPAPLTLADCSDGNNDGVPDAVEVSDALAGFKVVVENADCTGRFRCLCPGAGQTRDDFINIVVYGPKDLSQPVDIPLIPDGELMRIRLTVGGSAPDEIPLHVFAQIDNGVQKPTNGALLSIGDKSAIDQTCEGNCADPGDVSKVAFEDASITVKPGAGLCVGDCNSDGHVSTNELVLGIYIALGQLPADQCDAMDGNHNGVTVDELVNSVDNALNGCH